MGERTANVNDGDIGATLTSLAATIHGRRSWDTQSSYTARLLKGKPDKMYAKVAEEACEVIMACKDADHDHIRYEAADLIYHLLVVLEYHDVSIAELAGELDARVR